MRFYGRNEELSVLHRQFELVQTNRVARMAVVTGRRRIGKTTLVLKAFASGVVPFVYLFVSKAETEESLAATLIATIGTQLSVAYPPSLRNLSQAVAWAMHLSQTRPFVLMIDECQDLSSVNSGFWAQLQKVWDLNKSNSQLLLIMSGSIQSALEKIFGAQSEPLFGRADVLMTVSAFTTQEMMEIFQDQTPTAQDTDLLTLYALTGGVARYVELFVDAGAVKQKEMLDFVFSGNGSWYRAEGYLMAANEFRLEAPIYMEILRKVAAGQTKWAQIQDGIAGSISPYMRRLEELFRIIRRQYPIESKASLRQMRFSVADAYFRFWLRFISSGLAQALAETQHWENLKNSVVENLPTFMGRTLEDWFRQQCRESGHWAQVGAWWDRKGENEIDLVAIDRSGKRLLIAEVKTNPAKYDSIRLSAKAESFLTVNPQFKDFELKLRGLSVQNMTDTNTFV